MNKLTFDMLAVELTRNCNMFPPCKHCFRGDSDNIDIDTIYIDGLLNQTEIIGSLFFTGGEPLLCIDKMRYFLNKLYELGIPLFDFGFITNGLIYNDESIEIIKDYSKMVKLCCEMATDETVDIEKNIVIGVSIDKYHNNKEIAEENYNKYKQALKGYAQVVRCANGNLPRKEGRGRALPDGICNLNLEQAINKRVEILDKNNKPLCPQYLTYKMIKPSQIIICCDMYLSVKGSLLIAGLGMHEYSIVDNPKYRICRVDVANIYNSIIHYNRNKTDCLSLLKESLQNKKKNPFTDFKDILFMLANNSEDNSEMIKKTMPQGYIKIDDFVANVKNHPEYIDSVIAVAQRRDYTI